MTTKVLEPTAGDILRHAASLLEEWGSCSGKYVDEKGRMCEVGAVEAASGYATHGKVNEVWKITEFNFNKGWSAGSFARSVLYTVGGGLNHSDRATHQERVAKLLEAAAFADNKEKESHGY